jgi:hypothetical protein
VTAEEIAAEALRLIAGDRCERLTRGRCSDASSGYVRGARYGADAWCDGCVAADALARMGTGAELPCSVEEFMRAERDDIRRELDELRAATRTFSDQWTYLVTAARGILRVEQDVARAVELTGEAS